MRKNNLILKITLSGMLIALGLVLPFLTGQIPEIGAMLCPMHIPVLIGGFILGWKYGLIIGIITPILRSFSFGMPPLYPAAISFAFEFAVYGLSTGLLSKVLEKVIKNKWILTYIVLIIAMILGRITWGGIRYLLALLDGSFNFNLEMFISGAFISAWPGIILQLILIPIIYISLNNAPQFIVKEYLESEEL